MLKIKVSTCEWLRRISLVLSIVTFLFFWLSFADFSAAKTGLKWKDVSSAGTALWIFLILGAVIILLQLIPAVIMFFSFVGTGSHMGYKVIGAEKKEEDELTSEVSEKAEG
jgi:hypothetical protein